MGVTTDPNDPRLATGVDEYPREQAQAYLVLPPEKRKPVRRTVLYSYWHTTCNDVTSMSDDIAETLAADPTFYSTLYCATCQQHRPCGPDGEFFWVNRWDISHRNAEKDRKVGT